MKVGSPFSGKRIRQSSAKLALIKRRARRLRRYGLGVLDFVGGFNLSQYEHSRTVVREMRRKAAEEAAKAVKKKRGRPRKNVARKAAL